MNEYETKIELKGYLNVVWKRKWFMLLATLLFISSVFIVSSLLPTQWEVDAIFDPSKSVSITEDGKWIKQYFVEPETIANLISQAAYNNEIANKLNLDIKEFPRLTAEVLINTSLVRISTKEKNIEKAKLILNSLCDRLKTSLDSYANNKIKEIDSQIKSKEMEKSILEAEINAFKNKLDIIKQKKQEIEKEMTKIRKRTEELERERNLTLNKKNRNESDNLAILLYSSEIQQNSINQNMLSEWLGNKIIEEDNINIELHYKERTKFMMESELNDLNEIKKGIYYTKIAKVPTSSNSPTSPKKLFNVLIAAALGVLVSTILAFFLEYLEKQKARNKG
ncbi:MAG: Wzz/FepE/Etk N-terminal domain-containing protein [Candidatus Hodarchaeota archaeon]